MSESFSFHVARVANYKYAFMFSIFFLFSKTLVAPSFGPSFFYTPVERYLASAERIFHLWGKKYSGFVSWHVAFTIELKIGGISLGVLYVGDAKII